MKGFSKLNIGQRLRDLREKAGLTQNGLALKAGMSQTHLRRVELGQAGITVDHLEIICDALGISLKTFFDMGDSNDEFANSVAKLSPKQKQLLLDFLRSL